MGNKKWIRVLALCMAVVCTLTVVAAAGIDVNGDGKYTVWDLQALFKQNKTAEYKETVKQMLGGHGDELSPVDAEGKVYEIYTELGLRNMARLVEGGRGEQVNGKGLTFKLMQDVDLRNAKWTPITKFQGIFEGNGHAIKNVNVTAFDSGSYTSYSNQGFFAKISRDGEVKNLNLVNITLDASNMPANRINRIGLLAGSSTGLVQDCTTIGKVIDRRTELEKTAYVGTLLGAIETTQYDIPGVVFTEDFAPLRAEDEAALKEALKEALTIKTARYSSTKVQQDAADLKKVKNTLNTAIGTDGQPVVSKLAMDYAQTTKGKRVTKIVGIIGSGTIGSKPNASKHFWQDISGSVTMQDPILAERRQAVVDYMYQMCTAAWTPSKDMTGYFYRAGSTQNVILKCVESKTTTTAGQCIPMDDSGNAKIETREYKAGQSYRGIPYMHASSPLARFNAWLDNGKTKSTLPTSAYYCSYGGLQLALRKELTRLADPNQTVSFEIWTRDENDKPVEKITNAFDVTGFTRGDQALETVNGTMQNADISGYARYIGNDCSSAIMQAWRKVVSSDVANGGTVISGVRTMTPTADYQQKYGLLPVNNLVPTSADADTYYTELGTDAQGLFVAAYAKASRGDALICDDHSRMIAYDPIVIMKTDGTVDLDKSYFITHEQGRSSHEAGFVLKELADKYPSLFTAKGWKSDCAVNHLYTFRQLTEYSGMTTGIWGIGTAGHYMPMTLPVFHDVDSKAADTEQVTNSYAKWENGAIKSNFHIISTTADGVEVFTGVTQHQTTATDSSYVGHGYRDARVEVTMDELIAAHGADVAGKTVTVTLSNGRTVNVAVPAA